MAYLELLAAIYMGFCFSFINTKDLQSTLVLKAPIIPAGFMLGADALSRLGWI